MLPLLHENVELLSPPQGALEGEEEEDNHVTEEDVFEITGVVPPSLVAKLLNACASDSYDKLDDVVQDIIREGYR